MFACKTKSFFKFICDVKAIWVRWTYSVNLHTDTWSGSLLQSTNPSFQYSNCLFANGVWSLVTSSNFFSFCSLTLKEETSVLSYSSKLGASKLSSFVSLATGSSAMAETWWTDLVNLPLQESDECLICCEGGTKREEKRVMWIMDMKELFGCLCELIFTWIGVGWGSGIMGYCL